MDNTTLGKLFQIDIDWLRKWSGIGVCVMARPERKIPPTSKYLMEIREFLAKCSASVRMKKKPRRLRGMDSFIMDHLLSSNMSRRKIVIVNKVRLYLQVEIVAEIFIPEGTRLDPAWLGAIMVHIPVATGGKTFREDVSDLESRA